MNARILAALAVACIATPAMAHAREPFGPACDLPSAVMRQIPPEAIALIPGRRRAGWDRGVGRLPCGYRPSIH